MPTRWPTDLHARIEGSPPEAHEPRDPTAIGAGVPIRLWPSEATTDSVPPTIAAEELGMDRGRSRVAIGLSALITGATVLGGVLALSAAKWWIGVLALVGALIVGALQYQVLAQSERGRIFDFKDETDHEFVHFFANWYSQQGRHSIFCADLHWLAGAAVAEVRESIKSQGNKFTAFVCDDSGSAATEIRNAGGAVFTIPREIVDIKLKMSVVEDNESSELIFRKKRDGIGHSVRFERTHHANTVGLALTLIQACRVIARGAEK